jgi:hypothetical protein
MSQKASAGSGFRTLAIACMIVGVLICMASNAGDEKVGSTLLLGVPLVFVGFLFFYRGRQHAAKARAEGAESPLLDSKPDVLYLRSFQSDPSTVFQQIVSRWTTEEEELASILRPFGDMVAIGQPGERLPVPGAVRIYTRDSEWKQVVLANMRSASLVVIRAGSSPGLLWEVGQAIQTLDPERLVIFVLNLGQEDYSQFANRVRINFGLQLPVIETSSLMRGLIDRRESSSKVKPGFIAFRNGWQAEFLPLPATIIRSGYNDLKKAFSIALAPVFERNGIAARTVGRFGS